MSSGDRQASQGSSMLGRVPAPETQAITELPVLLQGCTLLSAVSIMNWCPCSEAGEDCHSDI